MDMKDDLHHLRTRYHATVDALERARAQELAALTDHQALLIMKSLSVVGTPWCDRPDWSGLVEQQVLFHRRSSEVNSRMAP